MSAAANLDLECDDPAIAREIARINHRHDRNRIRISQWAIRRVAPRATKMLTAANALERSRLTPETSAEILDEIAAISARAEDADLTPAAALSLMSALDAVVDRISSFLRPVWDEDDAQERRRPAFVRFERHVSRIAARVARETAEAEVERRLALAREAAAAERGRQDQERAERRKADKAARRLEAERRAAAIAAERAERLRQFRERHCKPAQQGVAA